MVLISKDANDWASVINNQA